MPDGDADPVKERSGWLFSIFSRYLVWRVRRRFGGLRVARDGLPRWDADRPVIVFTNHPSWWDPALFIVLMRQLFPARIGFGPMDDDALQRYGLLRRFGVFGIERQTRSGAARFLRVCHRLLRDPATILWLTAEGMFTDPRSRPLRLRPGLAHLARAYPAAQIVPMAIEYPFWDDSRPEALIRFGPVLMPDRDRSVAAWTASLTTGLQATMDALAEDACRRDPGRFLALISSRGGVNPIYDAWRWLRGRDRKTKA